MNIFEYIKKHYEEPIRLMTDRIVLGEFFSPVKPLEESFHLTLEDLKELAGEIKSESDIVPCFIQKKHKGISCQIHKNAENITIYSEDGRDITSRLPSLVKEAKKLKEEKVILNAILEMWEDGVCQSREKLSDYLYKGQKANDKALMASCFDCLWIGDRDLHKLTFKDRFKEMSSIALMQSTVGEPNFSKGHLNSAPTSFVQTEAELKKALTYFTRADPLKSAMIRFAEMDYPLNGLTAQNMNMRVQGKLSAAETNLKEGIKPAFGSPCDKFFATGKLVKLIPEHNVYVETMIGAGSLFFRKKPSQKEVINDKDSDIAFIYRFLKNHTEADLSALKKKNWTASKERFLQFKDLQKAIDGGQKQTSATDRFFRIMYLKGCLDNMEAGHSFKVLDRMASYKERLKNTIIENMDYREVIKKYDSPDTFFYMDPLSEKEVEVAVKTIKGKFLLSYEITSAFKDFQKKILVPLNLANPLTPQKTEKKEHLISNYPQRDYGSFVFESSMRHGYTWALQTSDSLSYEPGIFDRDTRKQTFEKVLTEALKRYPLSEAGIKNALEFFKKNDMHLTHRIMEVLVLKEAQHKRNQCMECSEPPELEVLWAEGMGHAWFCKEHFKVWASEHKGDIDYIKEVKEGEAADKFQNNPNPNIIKKILK